MNASFYYLLLFSRNTYAIELLTEWWMRALKFIVDFKEFPQAITDNK